MLAEHTAGDPQRGMRWTNLRPREIARRITVAGIPISRRIAGQLLKQNGFVRRQSQKKKTFKQHPDRQAQFERITELKQQYLAAGWPVISIDTKKKELLGNFYRHGKLYTRETIAVLDHDFPSYSDGKIIPHGVYDLGKNKAHVNLGISRDTTEFACDSVAHYPAYCSKYNPIEHRVFPHLTRACEGVVFESVALVKQLMERAQTCTGLRVTVDILNRVYENGRKAADHLKATINIVGDTLLPKWNYTISPYPSP